MAVEFYTLSLNPVNPNFPESFSGVYIKGSSILRISFGFISTPSGNPELTCKVKLDGQTYETAKSPLDIPLSRPIHRSGGDKTVSITLESGLGTGSYTRTIYVRSYAEPAAAPAVKGAKDIVCGRCSSDGTMSTAGENLRISAVRSYSTVAAKDGTDQRNYCTMRYRWKAASDDAYSAWTELLAGDTLSTDSVDRVLGLTLSRKTAYVIQVGVTDTVGNSHTITRQIPATFDTPLHLGEGGKNLGLGQYCNYEHEYAVDIGWQMFFNGGIGMKEAFRFDSRTEGWAGGTMLCDSLPDVDVNLLKTGTVFIAVVYHYFTGGLSTAPNVFRVLVPVMCTRISGEIAGQSVDTIMGYAWSSWTDSVSAVHQHQYPVKMTYVESSDSYKLDLNETDSKVKHLAALYVLF